MMRHTVRSWARPAVLAKKAPETLSLDTLASRLSRASIARDVPQDACRQCWQRRAASTASSASSRWKQRQGKDFFAREAKVQGLKSRAAFKLLEIDAKYRIFKRGQSVVDLGYAPGSWSQVAAERTKPTGRILGIDLIPAQPPRGVSTIQGDFLSPRVQHLVKQFLADDEVRRKRQRAEGAASLETSEEGHDADAGAVVEERPSYIDLERLAAQEEREAEAEAEGAVQDEGGSKGWRSEDKAGRLVDVSNPPLFLLPSHSDRDVAVRADILSISERQQVVLSDMSAPWPQTTGFSVNTLTNPYARMMNTSGMPFRDHAGSMDLCTAALSFANDTLRAGGHFVCKFYQGAEDKTLEKRLRKLFAKVHREKPDSSRSESKEAFFVALKRKGDVVLGVEDLEPPA